MFRSFNPGWKTFLIWQAMTLAVLGFYGSSSAAPRPTNEPFANSVEQRFEMINQLKELNAQIREQNALLRSGKLQVVIAPKR